MTIRTIFALCALLALSACLLMSRVPLVEKPAEVVGFPRGLYRPYVMVDPDKPRGIPRRLRSQCITPEHVYRIPADDGKPPRLVRLTYCPYDADAKRSLRPFRISREGDGYRFSGNDFGSNLTAGAATQANHNPNGELVRFEHLRGQIYLFQRRASDDHELFEYYFARVVSDGVDFAPLWCQDFPSLQPVEQGTVDTNVEVAQDENVSAASEVADSSDGDNVSVPANRAQCVAPSRAAIQPELDAALDKMDAGEQPVMLLLRRVDKATGGAVASPSH